MDSGRHAKKIVITGLGVVSSLGVGRREFTRSVRERRIGISDLTLAEPTGACEHAAEIIDYDWHDYLFSKQTYADRCTQISVGAARMALEDAGLPVPIPEEQVPVGICFGTCWGCVASSEKFYAAIAAGKGRSASSLVFSHSYPNCPTSFIAIEMGLRGYSTSFTGSDDAGVWALQSGVEAVGNGTADRLLVGAADAFAGIAWAHLEKTGALPDTRGMTPSESEKEIWARVPGEAAVFMVLEDEARAGERGAQVLASVQAAWLSCNKAHDWRQGDTRAAGHLLEIARRIVCG